MSISLHPDTPEGRTLAAAPADAAPSAASLGTKIRSRLFAKYVALFVAVVGVALASNGIFEVFFYYREHKASLIRIQHEQAEAAAAKIRPSTTPPPPTLPPPPPSPPPPAPPAPPPPHPP